MLTTPHLLVGAAIGAQIGPAHPLIVVPVAGASHFVLDSIPHLMGFIEVEDLDKKDVLFVLGDVILGVGILLLLSLNNPNWEILWIGAVAGMLPDFHHTAQVLFGPDFLKRYTKVHMRFHYKKPLRLLPGLATQFFTSLASIFLILAK
jgi:hypothetical protein